MRGNRIYRLSNLAERQATMEREHRKVEDCPFCVKAPNDEPIYALEPLNPVVPGHLLFIPSNHYQDAAEDPDITGLVFRSAAATAKALGHNDFNLITSTGEAATQSVYHLHVHLVPRTNGDGLPLPWTGQSANKAQGEYQAPDAVE